MLRQPNYALNPLGYRARQVLEYIRTQIDERGISPSYVEIRDALGLDSKSSVHRIVISLEGRGYVARVGNRWAGRGRRVIRLLVGNYIDECR